MVFALADVESDALARRRSDVLYAMIRDGTLYESRSTAHLIAACGESASRARDQATSRPSCPVRWNSRTCCVSASATASSSRSADSNPRCCQKGPERRLNSHALVAPSAAARSSANLAKALP